MCYERSFSIPSPAAKSGWWLLWRERDRWVSIFLLLTRWAQLGYRLKDLSWWLTVSLARLASLPPHVVSTARARSLTPPQNTSETRKWLDGEYVDDTKKRVQLPHRNEIAIMTKTRVATKRGHPNLALPYVALLQKWSSTLILSRRLAYEWALPLQRARACPIT